MSYYLKVLKDSPIGFWKLDEESGTTAFDSSGCGNNASYVGQFSYDYLPIIPGGEKSSKITNSTYINFPITKDYYGSNAKGGFANKYCSDNDFSLEVWAYISSYKEENINVFDGGEEVNESTSFFDGGLYSTQEYLETIDAGQLINKQIVIFADIENNIGIFFENNSIVFKLGTESIVYSLKELDRSIHIVCTYSKNNMSIYINGILSSSKPLSNFIFTNEVLNLKSGPIQNEEDFLLIDSPAIYRYALREDQIQSHFNSSNIISPIQIVEPDGGQLFLATDNNIKKPFEFKYPIDKQWSEFYDPQLVYDQIENYISIIPEDTAISKTVILYDQFSIPSNLNLMSSKIEWSGTQDIIVETSSDGVTYTPCENGRIIPQYKLGTSSFSISNIVYIKITLTTTDASKYIPKLYSLNFYFYNTKRIYAINGADYIEPIEPSSGTVDSSVWDYDISSLSYTPLSRKVDNGIRPYAPGFSINTLNNVYSVEMMFTPISTAANYLVFAGTNVYFSWNGSGVIAKNNISAVYVNGVDRSSATNISSFLTVGEMHHIVLVFSSTVTSKIWFNVKVLNNVWTDAGPRNLYSYISSYNTQISQSVAQNHYNLYTARSLTTAEIPSFAVTESAINVYNNDWLVIKSI